MGNLNGREGIEDYLGREGEETLHNNRERIIELSVENDLIIITNTRVKYNVNEKSIIDYFLITKTKCKINCEGRKSNKKNGNR